MKPQLAYLIDENRGWEDEPDWKFYTEADIPLDRLKYARGAVKRIVYWEIEEIE